RTLSLRVRCQNLLEQRRARARQADDEDRIRALVSPALPGCEELGCTDPDLLVRVLLDELRAITAFGTLELITLPVVAERLAKVALIFERLTDGETQVIAIDERGGWRRHRVLHSCQVIGGEAVRLEVRKAPV